MKRREFMGCVAAGGAAALGAARCREAADGRVGFEEGNQPRSHPESDVHGSLDPRIEVRLDRIGWNLERIKERAGVPVLAVVKANAYGHGLVEVGRYLEARGVHGLMVGKLAEAHSLRAAGIRCPIYNFGPFGRDDAGTVVDEGIVQSVFTDDVRALDEAVAKAGRRVGINVHVDTGMSRAGIPAEKALAYLEMVAGLKSLDIKGISTTFTEDPEFDREQLNRFLEVCGKAGERGIDVGLRHAASSAGLFSGPEFHLDMVRPGIALYGYYPNAATRAEDALRLRPALRFVGRVTFVRELKAGESISYLRAVRAEKPMRVATVGAGYSDGYPPALGGKGVVLIKGKMCPLLPAVTSNHIMIDLENDDAVRVGDEAVLVDDGTKSGVSADALAGLGGTSDYKILIGLNPLLSRIHLGESG